MLCINPDSDSDVVIEEGEEDFREKCIIIKGEKKNVEEEKKQSRLTMNNLNNPLKQKPNQEHLL